MACSSARREAPSCARAVGPSATLAPPRATADTSAMLSGPPSTVSWVGAAMGCPPSVQLGARLVDGLAAGLGVLGQVGVQQARQVAALRRRQLGARRRLLLLWLLLLGGHRLWRRGLDRK